MEKETSRDSDEKENSKGKNQSAKEVAEIMAANLAANMKNPDFILEKEVRRAKIRDEVLKNMKKRQEIEKEIEKLAKTKSKALIEKDIKTLKNLIDERFRYINSHGLLANKNEYIKNNADNSRMEWISQNYMDPIVSIYGNIAFLESIIKDQFKYDSKSYEGTFRTLMIFIHYEEPDKWKWLQGFTVEILKN